MEARQIGQEARSGVSESTGLCGLERVVKSGAGREGLGGEVGIDAVVVVASNELEELER